MRKSLLKLLGFVVCITLSSAIFAMGMGGINVTSGLGQVLTADIELVAVNKADKASLVARLASPDVYKSAGLEYPYGNKYKFQIESRANGEPYLKVTSAQPINDPFVVMLVELTWSSGRLLREYTFLLDPPGYVAELPEQGKVQPLAPAVETAAVVAAEIPVESVAQIQEPMPTSQPTAEATPTEQDMEKPRFAIEQSAPEADVDAPKEKSALADVAEPNEEWLAVKRGDTLGKISALYKPDDVSLERMLVALYRANASQFDGKNMNRIRAGKILRMPTQEEVEVVGQSEAVKEIRAQVSDWNAYRQKLASAAALRSQPQATTEQVVTGKLSSSVADKTPVAKESAKEVLKLSRGEAPGDKAATGAGGKSLTGQDTKNAAQEDAIAEAKTAKEEQMRTALLEKNIQDMERLAKLKSSAAALAQQPKESSAEAAASEVKPTPVVKPKPKPAPVKEEPSLVDQMMAVVDQLMAEPIYLAGGAGVLVALGALGWLVSRRKQGELEVISNFSDDEGLRSGRISDPTVSSPDTGDFTNIGTSQTQATEFSNEADPISEADLFLNFGRDAQAEEILKDALQNTPDNHKIHLKLLEIYASRKDLGTFEIIARQLQDTGDEEAYQQALAMGRELDPSNPLYDATAAQSGTSSVQAPPSGSKSKLTKGEGSSAQAPSVDFDLGAPAAKSEPSPEDDFLSDALKTVSMSASTSPTPEEDFLSGAVNNDTKQTAGSTSKPVESVDFDLSAPRASAQPSGDQEKSSLPDLGDLIFDVTGERPAFPAASAPGEVSLPKIDDMTLNLGDGQTAVKVTKTDTGLPKADDTVMEFTLDFPGDENTEKPLASAKPVEAGFAGINLNFDDSASVAAPASDNKDDHWQEVATKLDLAKAYQEMGDASGAREIIEEVLREGDDEQRQAAQTLLSQLG